MIPGSRRNLFKDQSFGESDNAGTKAFKWHASGALHAKEKVGRGGGAHRGWYSVGERGDGELLWVSAWCCQCVNHGSRASPGLREELHVRAGHII